MAETPSSADPRRCDPPSIRRYICHEPHCLHVNLPAPSSAVAGYRTTNDEKDLCSSDVRRIVKPIIGIHFDAVDALTAWVSTRHEARRLRALRASFGACELREPAEMEVGFGGVPACYQSGEDDKAEWCEPCRQRDVVYPSLLAALAEQRRRFRRLERIGLRLFTCVGSQP